MNMKSRIYLEILAVLLPMIDVQYFPAFNPGTQKIIIVFVF